MMKKVKRKRQKKKEERKKKEKRKESRHLSRKSEFFVTKSHIPLYFVLFSSRSPSLREEFATEGNEINPLHGSDTAESAAREVDYFFPMEHTLCAVKPTHNAHDDEKGNTEKGKTDTEGKNLAKIEK